MHRVVTNWIWFPSSYELCVSLAVEGLLRDCSWNRSPCLLCAETRRLCGACRIARTQQVWPSNTEVCMKIEGSTGL